MEAQHTILLVLFGFSLLIGGTNGNCDQTYEVQKCMDILQPGMNLKALAGKQPSWNRTQLDHVCRHVDEFFLCYDNFVGRCSDDGLPKVKVVLTATLDYMCGKGREHTIKDFEVTKGNCDQISGIQKCMNILQQGIELKTITKNHESWNRTQLDHACRHLDEYFLCYDNFVERCGDDGLRKVKVVLTGTFDYICGKGRELYLKSRVCLNEEPTSSNIKKCVVKSHMNPTKGEVCDKINDLSKCLNRAADHCGEDGKKYIDGLFKELISGLIDCDGLSHGVIIAIVGAVTVTFSLVAFVITSLMKRRKRHVPFEKMESCEST